MSSGKAVVCAIVPLEHRMPHDLIFFVRLVRQFQRLIYSFEDDCIDIHSTRARRRAANVYVVKKMLDRFEKTAQRANRTTTSLLRKT